MFAFLLAVGTVARAQETPEATPESQEPLFDQPGYGLPSLTSRPSYLDLDAGAAYTDNALLTPDEKRSTGIGMAGVDMDYTRAGSELNISARGSVDWLQYFDNLYPGTPYGNFDGTAIWGRTTDLLQWVVRETYTEGMTDPLAAPTLNAVEGINYVTTGPYLNLNFTSMDRLTLYGSYSNTTFQKSPFDSMTYDGGGLLVHQVSAASSVGVQVDSAQTSFQYESVSPNYALRSAQVIYSGDFSRTAISGAAGYSSQNYGAPMSGAPLISLELSRRISPSSTVYVRGHDEYMTVGTNAQSDLSAPLSTAALAAPTTATSGPFKNRLLSLGWNFVRPRTTLSLALSAERELYVKQATLDSNAREIMFTAQRRISPTVSLSLQGYTRYTRFSNVGGQLTDTVANVSMVKQYRRVSVSLYAQRTHQNSSAVGAGAAGIATGSYDEDRVGLTFAFNVIGNRFSAIGYAP